MEKAEKYDIRMRVSPVGIIPDWSILKKILKSTLKEAMEAHAALACSRVEIHRVSSKRRGNR